MGRRHQADIQRSRCVAAKPAHFPRFQHAKQLRLKIQRQLADLVEEHRTAVGLFENPGPTRGRAGEGAHFVTEEFARDEVGIDGTAIQHHKGTFVRGTRFVDRTRHQLLTGTGGAVDEQRHRGRGRPIPAR